MIIRVAKPASRARNLVKTALQTTFMWTAALYAGPQIILSLERAWAIPGFHPPALAGWTLFGFASALGLWSGWTMAWYGSGTPLPFDTAREFVIRGPYRYIRNPMALAGVSQGVFVGLILGSYTVVAYGVAGGMVWNYIVRPFEEADLVTRFGQAYLRYRGEVPCWRFRIRGVIAKSQS